MDASKESGTSPLYLLFGILLLAVVLFFWVSHPEKRWLRWTMGIAFGLVLALPALGLLVGPPH